MPRLAACLYRQIPARTLACLCRQLERDLGAEPPGQIAGSLASQMLAFLYRQISSEGSRDVGCD